MILPLVKYVVDDKFSRVLTDKTSISYDIQPDEMFCANRRTDDVGNAIDIKSSLHTIY